MPFDRLGVAPGLRAGIGHGCSLSLGGGSRDCFCAHIAGANRHAGKVSPPSQNPRDPVASEWLTRRGREEGAGRGSLRRRGPA
ncbi:hypothetical protein MTP06_42160 [Streptomyces sp. PLM4]|uniref:Uncharacterized protein n=1 Tax=Streptomyces albidoflavus TaxID=1886 RepID=A0AA37BXF2_9ACTN|nr:hypothetical protein MTP02_18160 [Streptomyces albus]BDH70767.1 hypothetical protein MTP06_42160 [Streptomyces sp. PLM4]GHI45946.1 hypothetical protein ScoT_21200 [Streptomyces albidoflavus]